jgi:hypothetical protein
MEQRTIVAYLALKGSSPRAIHKNLMDTLGPDALTYSLLTCSLRKAYSLPRDQDTPSVEGDRDIDEADQAFLFALDENPFSSVQQLS